MYIILCTLLHKNHTMAKLSLAATVWSQSGLEYLCAWHCYIATAMLWQTQQKKITTLITSRSTSGAMSEGSPRLMISSSSNNNYRQPAKFNHTIPAVVDNAHCLNWNNTRSSDQSKAIPFVQQENLADSVWASNKCFFVFSSWLYTSNPACSGTVLYLHVILDSIFESWESNNAYLLTPVLDYCFYWVWQTGHHLCYLCKL